MVKNALQHMSFYQKTLVKLHYVCITMDGEMRLYVIIYTWYYTEILQGPPSGFDIK